MDAGEQSPVVEIVMVPEQALVCLRGRGPVRELAERLRRLTDIVQDHALEPAGSPLARFYDDEYDPADTDFDVCLPVRPAQDGSIPDSIGEAAAQLVPGHPALTTTHRGPHPSMGPAHAALRAELARLGYTAAGPVTEVFLTGPLDGVAASEYVTEVRRPYAR